MLTNDDYRILQLAQQRANQKRQAEGWRLAPVSVVLEKHEHTERPVRPAVESRPDQVDQAERIKVWALVGCQAWQARKGGGWRVWAISHHLDKRGSGRVSRLELWDYLRSLGVGERKRRRWISQALRSGFMVYSAKVDDYFLTSLGKVAAIIGAGEVGLPADISVARLVSPGWRSVVWAGVLAAMQAGKPMSRARLQVLSGLDERTQYNLEQQLAIIYRKNYAQTKLAGDHLTGIVEHGRGSAFVGDDNRIYYRLPDTRIVSQADAIAGAKGRSRKAQKRVNTLLSQDRGKVQVFRLFHERQTGAEREGRRIGKADIAPWDSPNEVYYLERAGRTNNLWQPQQVREGCYV